MLSICEKDHPLLKDNDTVLLHPSADYKLADVPYMMESNESFKHLVISELGSIKAEEIFKRVFSRVNQINAAGGLIVNPRGEYLMIYRNGFWDLPKGKQEENENIALTAKREVLEEVGIECVPENLICITHHTYRLNNRLSMKNTYWYMMHSKEGEEPTPQVEEGIEECRWCRADQIEGLLQNSFLTIRDIFKEIGII